MIATCVRIFSKASGTFRKHFKVAANLNRIGTISRCCIYVPLTGDINPQPIRAKGSTEQKNEADMVCRSQQNLNRNRGGEASGEFIGDVIGAVQLPLANVEFALEQYLLAHGQRLDTETRILLAGVRDCVGRVAVSAQRLSRSEDVAPQQIRRIA
jgi:hypothetical protein